EDMRTAVREHICEERDIFLLGNGIDLERFDRAPLDDGEQRALRRQLGFDDRDLIVGFVGRLVEEKGILELFEAMREARAKEPRAKLIVIGPLDAEKRDALTPEV